MLADHASNLLVFEPIGADLRAQVEALTDKIGNWGELRRRPPRRRRRACEDGASPAGGMVDADAAAHGAGYHFAPDRDCRRAVAQRERKSGREGSGPGAGADRSGGAQFGRDRVPQRHGGADFHGAAAGVLAARRQLGDRAGLRSGRRRGRQVDHRRRQPRGHCAGRIGRLQPAQIPASSTARTAGCHCPRGGGPRPGAR